MSASRLWVALDTPSLATAEAWIRALWPHRHYKVGLELFTRAGPEAVARWAREGCAIFLDLKLHDIPHTVAGAVAAARELGAEMVTVHASGGPAMLEAAAQAKGAMAVVAVTVLTSLEGRDLARLGWSGETAELVRRWAELAHSCGVDGVVCSAHEVADLRQIWPESRRVVPGLRLLAGTEADQKRVATPWAAVQAGATDLVVGRAVTQDPEPARRLAEVLQAIGAR
ncbi:MAG: orotidine-5'-phosphate decarboxylase [Firmicutes bacterium]|nr:orotidine-5'-phosphate decarboxylase [Bacillota bacterium]